VAGRRAWPGAGVAVGPISLGGKRGGTANLSVAWDTQVINTQLWVRLSARVLLPGAAGSLTEVGRVRSSVRFS